MAANDDAGQLRCHAKTLTAFTGKRKKLGEIFELFNNLIELRLIPPLRPIYNSLLPGQHSHLFSEVIKYSK